MEQGNEKLFCRLTEQNKEKCKAGEEMTLQSVIIYRCAYCGVKKEVDSIASQALFPPTHNHNNTVYVFKNVGSAKEPIKTEEVNIANLTRETCPHCEEVILIGDVIRLSVDDNNGAWVKFCPNCNSGIELTDALGLSEKYAQPA